MMNAGVKRQSRAAIDDKYGKLKVKFRVLLKRSLNAKENE